MRVSIVSIGNSKGVRIPKALLEQCRFTTEAELEVQDDHLVIKPVKKARDGWTKALKLMHERGEDALVIDDALDLGADVGKW